MDLNLIVSLPQIVVTRGDFDYNLASHLKAIHDSANQGADLVVFPELSLTGYELDIAREWSPVTASCIFAKLAEAATSYNVTLLVGCPIHIENSEKPAIGAVILSPCGQRDLYLKQHLHTGEEEYCIAGDKAFCLELNGLKLGIGICADFTVPQHAQSAKRSGCHAYLSSALISDEGYVTDAEILANIAKDNAFPVLLSNHISKTGGWLACGKNSVWDHQGRCQGSAPEYQVGIYLVNITRVNNSKQSAQINKVEWIANSA